MLLIIFYIPFFRQGTRVYIMLSQRWQSLVEGLCGNFNGVSEDEEDLRPSQLHDAFRTSAFCSHNVVDFDMCEVSEG